MLGCIEDLVDRPGLDDLPVSHDDHLISNLGDHAHVVCDEHHGHAMALLQTFDQVQNLGLRGHVQSSGGFVGDQ